MKITPEQLEDYKNQLILTNCEIDLQEKELAAWKARGEAERNLYRFIVDVSADPGVSRKPLAAFNDAQKAHYAAQADLKQLAIVKLRSQSAILTAMIAEADKVILEPKKGLVDLE
jgi:hypothetical protein